MCQVKTIFHVNIAFEALPYYSRDLIKKIWGNFYERGLLLGWKTIGSQMTEN
jgi:hypothetical protein